MRLNWHNFAMSFCVALFIFFAIANVKKYHDNEREIDRRHAEWAAKGPLFKGGHVVMLIPRTEEGDAKDSIGTAMARQTIAKMFAARDVNVVFERDEPERYARLRAALP